MVDKGAILPTKTDIEEVARKDMNEGEEEVGLHITNDTEVVVVKITRKITGEGVEVVLRRTEKGIVIMRTPRVHPKEEREGDRGEMTGEDVEVALRDTETVVMTIDPEIDVKETDIKKTDILLYSTLM